MTATVMWNIIQINPVSIRIIDTQYVMNYMYRPMRNKCYSVLVVYQIQCSNTKEMLIIVIILT